MTCGQLMQYRLPVRHYLEERRDRWEGGNVFHRGTAAAVKLPSVGTRHIFPYRIVPDSVWRHAQTAQDIEIARDYLPFSKQTDLTMSSMGVT